MSNIQWGVEKLVRINPPKIDESETEKLNAAIREVARAMSEHLGRQLIYGLVTGFAPNDQRVTLVKSPQLEAPTIDAQYEVK